MATQSNINVDEGTGPDVDFVTLPTSSNRRQVVAVGDPDTDEKYASVDPGGNLHVLIRPTFVVAVQYTNATIQFTNGTLQFTNSTITAYTNATIQATNSTITANQGTPGTAPNAWFVSYTNQTIQFTNATITAFTNATTQFTNATITANQGTAGSAAWIVQFTNATIQSTNSTISAVGNVDSGVADTGNPVKVGYVARTALPSAVTNGQRVNSYGDKFGRQVVIPQTTRDLVGTNFTTIASTAESPITVQQGAGVYADMDSIWITNTGNTQTVVTIRQVTSGATIVAFLVPAQDMRGAVFNVPLAHSTTNGTWFAQLSNSVIATVSVKFIKNQ